MPSSQYGRHWGYHPDSGGFGARHLLAGASVDLAPRGIWNWSIHNSTNANADQVQLRRSGAVKCLNILYRDQIIKILNVTNKTVCV